MLKLILNFRHPCAGDVPAAEAAADAALAAAGAVGKPENACMSHYTRYSSLVTQHFTPFLFHFIVAINVSCCVMRAAFRDETAASERGRCNQRCECWGQGGQHAAEHMSYQ